MSKLPTVFPHPRSPFWYCSWYHDRKRDQFPIIEMRVDEHSKEEALAFVLLKLGFTAKPEEKKDLKWLLEETKRRVEREGLKATTWKEYNIALTHLINALGSSKLVSEITRADVTRFQEWLLKRRGIAPITVNKTCSTIRAAFDRIYADEIISRNPFY